MKQQSRFLGIILAILGASFWGLGGTVSDYLFNIKISTSTGTLLHDS